MTELDENALAAAWRLFILRGCFVKPYSKYAIVLREGGRSPWLNGLSTKLQIKTCPGLGYFDQDALSWVLARRLFRAMVPPDHAIMPCNETNNPTVDT